MDILEQMKELEDATIQAWWPVFNQLKEKFGDDWEFEGTMDMLRQYEYPSGLPNLTREMPKDSVVFESYPNDPHRTNIAKLAFEDDDGGYVWRPMLRLKNGLFLGVNGKYAYSEDSGECLMFD